MVLEKTESDGLRKMREALFKELAEPKIEVLELLSACSNKKGC